MKYTVTSDRIAGHAQGDTVTDDDLEGANVPALIAAGHLAEAKPKNSRKANPESEAD
ncbi:MAG: hypothetical protein ACPHDT_13305 [Acidimicrobiales bacterium]